MGPKVIDAKTFLQRHLPYAALAAAVVASGCVDIETMTLKVPQGAGVAATPAISSQAVEAEVGPLDAEPTAIDASLVRAPEVFQASALAVWDGKRTAKGIWIAHPDVRVPMQVRIVNPATKIEVDGIVYRHRDSAAGDVLTVSSDAATALKLRPKADTQISIFALRPASRVSRQHKSSAESRAQIELASHIGRLDENELLQLVAAAMRGMGFATTFSPVTRAESEPAIRAFPQPGSGVNLPSVGISVRTGQQNPMTAEEVKARQEFLQGSGDLGIIVSVSGFAADAQQALSDGKVHMELVDLDGLMNIWVTHYEQLSEPDRALLRLQPVYFLAGG